MDVALRGPVAGSRMQTAATWLFVLPLFIEGVAVDVVKIEVAALAVLAFTALVILPRPIPERAIKRIYLTFAVLVLLVIAYLALGSWPSNAGTARSYDNHAMIFVGANVAVAIFAVLFFEKRLFERVIWRAATLALWIGVASCALSRLTGRPLLVNAADGGLRMVGTLTEPSDWAPVLGLVVLLALRRRSWPYVALALAGLALTDSPTCILVLVVTVPLYYALVGTGRQRALTLAALAVLIPAGIFFVQQTSPQRYLDSGNAAEVAVGRLLSGIRNVETGGQQGANGRFASTRLVITDAKAHGWIRFGAGPAADSTYFPVMYPNATGGVAYGANALWVAILFEFGVGGVVVLGLLMLAAASRMWHYPSTAAILLPFFIASLVNSTGANNAFVALGIMLFAFGWERVAADSRQFPGPQCAEARLSKLHRGALAGDS
jgi:hypothetical protein